MKFFKNFAPVFVLIVGSFFGLAINAHAATISLSSNTDVLHIGDTLEVLIKIDTEGAGVNAIQGTLQYPKDILQATNIDKTDSIFNFWLQEPTFSNDTGRVNFVGGSTVGSVGKSLQALKVVFTVKGVGRADLTLTDAAVTASDGSGTNVLSTINGLTVNSVSATGSSASAPISALVPPPTQITRPAAAASGLPSRPVVTIPLYPDPTAWSNRTDAFIAQWTLPADVSAVDTALDQNVSYGGATSQGLFDSKVFPSITQDGVWYLHVRFKNSIGWGAVNNYRIAIDTHPPLSFTASIIEGNSTDTPAPTLKFDTKDSLSGLKDYEVSVDSGSPILVGLGTYKGTFKLPLQAPGKHRISIRAVDNAGNSAENDITLETIPLPSPVIAFVTSDLFSNQQTGVAVKGSAEPLMSVILTLQQGGIIIAEDTVSADANGTWDHLFNNQLVNGAYKVGAQTKDARGALSLVVASPSITVQSEPILQLGIIKLGAGGTAVLMLLLLIGAFVGGVLYWKKRNEKLALRVGFAGSEISKIFKLIEEDVKKISAAAKTPTAADDDYALKSFEENLKKMEAYLKKGIEKIQK